MAKYTEEEYREAARIWRDKNPTKEKIPRNGVIEISNGKIVPLGTRINNMRSHLESLDDNQKEFWKDYGIFDEKKSYTEEEYREAATIWKSKNPEVKRIPSRLVVEISNGKIVPLGARINTMRSNLEKLDDDQKEFWKDYGIFDEKKSYTEEEYREAATIWKSKNPEVKRIPNGLIVEISNGKIIPIGNKMKVMRANLESLDDNQKEFWKDYGMFDEKKSYTEEEYREAAEIWKSKNPTKEKIPQNTVIEISNGKIIPIGNRIYYMCSHPEILDDNQKEFWKDYGIFDEKKSYTEEEYREAARIWKSKNPTKEKIPQNTVIEISNGKIVPLGIRIMTMRSYLESLSDSQKEFWKDYGLFCEKKSYTEEEYREAAIIWKSKNPKKEKIPQNAVIEISSGRIIPIGNKMKVMRANPESLDKEKQEFWKDYGLIFNRKVRNLWTEEEYREAAIIWKSKNPNATRISVNVVEKISNGKEVLLGNRMHKMRSNLEKLTEEQKEFWKDYGLFDEKMISYTEEEYREAAIIWRSKNPSIKKIPQGAVEIISSGKEVLLGNRMDKMRRNLVKLDEEQKEFWKNFGLFYKKEDKIDNISSKLNSLEKYIEMFDGDREKAIRVEKCLKDLREKRRVKKKHEWNIDNILKEFDVDLETLEKYLARTRTKETEPRAKVLEYEGKTLRSFCIENVYNYDVVVRAIKLHDMCRYDTLEQLINRSLTTYNKKGQREPATWIYEKYGNLVKHVLLHLKLDSASILRDMTNYIMTLEEAVRHDVFKRNIDAKENSWLEELYNYLIDEINDNKEQKQTEEDITEMFVILVHEYKLTKEEYQVLWKTFSKYVDTMREYQRVDVGLETNQSKKLEKIRQYNLDEYDIEESFFIPLEFDRGVLLGRHSELYKRRQLLKQYIIDWDYYSDMEKEAIRQHNNFTDEELIYIKNTREEINEVIEESNKHM